MEDEVRLDLVFDQAMDRLDQTNQFLERIAMALESIQQTADMLEASAEPPEFRPSNIVPQEPPLVPIQSEPMVAVVNPQLSRAVAMYGPNAETAWENESARRFMLWAMTKGYGSELVQIGVDGVIATDISIKQQYQSGR